MAKFHYVPVHERAGLSREGAAEYVGVSSSLFDEMVRDGRMPLPKMINTRRVWLRTAIEKAFTALPDVGTRHDNPSSDCV